MDFSQNVKLLTKNNSLFVGFSLKMFLFNILILKNKRKIMSNTTRYHPYSPLISSGSQSTSHRQQSSTSSPLPSQTPNTPTNIQATQSQQTETTDSTRHILRVNVGQLFMKKVENALISWNIPREDFVGDLNEYWQDLKTNHSRFQHNGREVKLPSRPNETSWQSYGISAPNHMDSYIERRKHELITR